ncbi:SHOCT domain-containing protein [Mucilaginibacter sp. HMF5004]|uniref:SHOCT domain-containing protein n=1 Tax=Mucilaginibacter rivuli TaxID=2857527 RepID=UPI001C5F045A|nr:SHOCT domain-containing protein [Mucilaginibacter rivuli]MBW4888465.1 SHOCT domain-containing protein [Mucilaginibacter rivuli]
MKKLAFLLLLLPLASFAQILGLGKKLTEYKASNGITYRIGDTVRLGQGSAPNGTFRYVQYAGWMTFMSTATKGADSHNLERNGSGYNTVIKKIHSSKANGAEKVVFAVGMGGANNFDLWIEDCIASCEIAACKANAAATTAAEGGDKFDQLKKLKALYDGGAITAAEYDVQKKKLLNQ